MKLPRLLIPDAPAGGISAPPAPAAPAPTPASSAPPPSPGGVPTTPGRTRPSVNAAKVLGLPEAPSKTAAGIVKDQQRRAANNSGSSNLPPSPTRGNVPAAEPVVPPAATPPAPEPPPAPAATPPAPAAPAATPPPDPTQERIAKLEKELEDYRKQQAQPPTPATPPVVPETAEQKEARVKQVREQEKKWVGDYAKNLSVELTAEQVDVINGGGPEAVAMLSEIRKTDIASAILEARKTIFGDMNPLLDRLQNENALLMQNHMQLEQHRVEQQFVAAHPDLAPQIETCRTVAQTLLSRYPKECSAMTPEAFIAEVARQSDHVLNMRAQQFGYTNWRELPKAQQTPPAPAAPAAPVPGAPAPAAPAAPPAPRPPAPHAPVGSGVRPGSDKSKQIAMSLRE